MLGEGAAILVLEEMERSQRRGARIYAELIGYGATNDATHLTEPSPEVQTRAMSLSLTDAGLTPEAIDYINAHGTATPIGDLVETQAIKQVFGALANCEGPTLGVC